MRTSSAALIPYFSCPLKAERYNPQERLISLTQGHLGMKGTEHGYTLYSESVYNLAQTSWPPFCPEWGGIDVDWETREHNG
jgi:hypothetical protein